MKRITCLIMSVICILTLAGCQEITYEQNLLLDAEAERSYFETTLEEAKEDGLDFTIEVNRISEYSYEVTLFGETERNDFVEVTSYDELNIGHSYELDKDAKNYAKSARENIISYINSSSVLKDKKNLIAKINSVEVKFADIDIIALYQNGIIYVRESATKSTLEHAITHQYIHALCEITNGVEDKAYKHTQFHEALTEVICRQLCTIDLETDYENAYSEYYYYILVYIGCFKDQALNAYFYGYDDIWKKTKRDDFDFFVYMFSNVNENKYASACFTALIDKWS